MIEKYGKEVLFNYLPMCIIALLLAIWVGHTMTWVHALPALGIPSNIWRNYYGREFG